MSGDMCSNAPKTCGNTAHPGHDLCEGCIADRQAEREITHRKAQELTAAKELEVSGQDEVLAA